MVNTAADFAGTVGQQLNDYTAKYGDRAASAEYQKLGQALNDLEEALESAIAMDKAQADSFWMEAKAFLRDGFNYWGEKAKFDAAVAAIVDGARAAMGKIRALVEKEAIPKIPLPDELTAVSERWRAVASEAETVTGRVPELQSVEGWAGSAYERYRTMTGVQVEACKEYVNMPRALTRAYASAADLNKAVLSVVYREITGARSASAQCYVPQEGRYYVHTASMRNTLEQCLGRLPEALGVAEAPSSSLGSELSQVRSAPVVISGGWPSGASMAGRRAGDTSADAPAPATPNVPKPNYPSGPADGVER